MSFCCVTVDSEVGLILVFQDFLPFKPPLIELLEVDAVVEVGVVGVPRKRRDLAILWCELVFCNFRELKKQPLLHDFFKGQIISKCLFGVFNFFQKQTKTRRKLVKMNSFVRFLEEFTN